MRGDVKGSHVGFDPVGLLIQPGQTVRFVCEANYHTTAAYHPGNANHSLHMPSTAQPWSSDVLQPSGLFEVTPGVYDYFCTPYEEAGMVGRLVGQPIGPATYRSRRATGCRCLLRRVRRSRRSTTSCTAAQCPADRFGMAH
jgi:plastocyanin